MTALTIQDVSRRSGLSEPTLACLRAMGVSIEDMRAKAPGPEPARLIIHNDRAKQELGWRPRPAETTIIETAERACATSACCWPRGTSSSRGPACLKGRLTSARP
jgi:hypothetical protein